MIYNYAYYFIQIERHSRRESGVKDIKARINRNVVRNSEKYVKDWFQAPILPESAPLETVGFLRRAATVTDLGSIGRSRRFCSRAPSDVERFLAWGQGENKTNQHGGRARE